MKKVVCRTCGCGKQQKFHSAGTAIVYRRNNILSPQSGKPDEFPVKLEQLSETPKGAGYVRL